MIMAVPSATLALDPVFSGRVTGNEWSSDRNIHEVHDALGNEVPLDELAQTNTDLIVEQLFHMTLSSLRGYQELAQLTSCLELRSLLEVIARQRSARCRALARRSQGAIPEWKNLEKSDDAALADPSAADLQIVWLRTIWNFEQDEFARFGENLDQAEMMLEDAFLDASEAFVNSEFAAIFKEHAINICGARQCLEDVVGDHVSSERY